MLRNVCVVKSNAYPRLAGYTTILSLQKIDSIHNVLLLVSYINQILNKVFSTLTDFSITYFIHHITDIRTGKPSDSGLLGVTLVGANAEELDALATAAFIMGAEKSMELLKQRNIEALFITDDKKVYVTENLREKIRI